MKKLRGYAESNRSVSGTYRSFTHYPLIMPLIDELTRLKVLSANLGADSLLVQAAGGNTSLKQAGQLWIKASGKQLGQALQEEIFLPLDLASIHQEIAGIGAGIQPVNGLRPSIETTLHALMPHRVVVHTHPVDVIAQTVLPDSQATLAQRLDGLNWAWVPYCRPGKPLTQCVAAILALHPYDVLILANHGLVIGADTCEEAAALHRDIIHRVGQPPRRPPAANLPALLHMAASIPGAYLPPADIIHSLATDPWSLVLSQQNPPYPDHLVFCGAGPVVVPSLSQWQHLGSRLENRFGESVSYLLFPELGVLLLETASSSTIAMLEAQAQVFLRLPPQIPINVLSDRQCAELMNWDAEKYRKSLELVPGS